MRRLKEVIASHQRSLRKHRLFDLIEMSNSVESLARLARSAAWWPMAFQDVLRLNVDRVRGTWIERFAEYHQVEDSGHDRWYLEDLRVFGVEAPALDELFGDKFRAVRDACYAIIGEVLRPQTGPQRVALLLALEPTGHVFFEQISAAVDRICPNLPLRYFARSHLGVEKDHDLFTESTEAELAKITLSDAERAQSEAMVARVYGTFANIFSYFADEVLETVRSQSHVRELGAPDAAAATTRHAGGS